MCSSEWMNAGNCSCSTFVRTAGHAPHLCQAYFNHLQYRLREIKKVTNLVSKPKVKIVVSYARQSTTTPSTWVGRRKKRREIIASIAYKIISHSRGGGNIELRAFSHWKSFHTESSIGKQRNIENQLHLLGGIRSAVGGVNKNWYFRCESSWIARGTIFIAEKLITFSLPIAVITITVVLIIGTVVAVHSPLVLRSIQWFRHRIYTVINCILRFADKTLPSLPMR